ncbi:hypothetical protein [Geoalkalibacter subterraneus]|uniref:Uncharacterized protein n=1 Tax=Geoalkalibacter subterraneus TaxID=483547 RepID=A0A0B5FDK1_9BACT|nr:hypothetical protein [Geoalkalibacter subterraneus]AJF06237.1 hypothetical protein GSUB_06270 [Geoalkalibacter subterraneus]
MTRHPLYWSAFCCLLLVLSGCAEMKGGDLAGNVLSALSTSKNGGTLDEGTVAAALKEALSVGSERAVAATSQDNVEMATIEKLHQGGKTVVIVTHSPEIAARAQQVVQVRDGLLINN